MSTLLQALDFLKSELHRHSDLQIAPSLSIGIALDKVYAIAQAEAPDKEGMDEPEIEQLITHAMELYPDKVEEYCAGNKALLGIFMGHVMKETKAQHAAMVHGMLKKALDSPLRPSPVRWTEEEMREIARKEYPPDTTNDGEPFYTDAQAQRNTYFKSGLRYARDHGLLSGEGEEKQSSMTDDLSDRELKQTAPPEIAASLPISEGLQSRLDRINRLLDEKNATHPTSQVVDQGLTMSREQLRDIMEAINEFVVWDDASHDRDAEMLCRQRLEKLLAPSPREAQLEEALRIYKGSLEAASIEGIVEAVQRGDVKTFLDIWDRRILQGDAQARAILNTPSDGN